MIILENVSKTFNTENNKKLNAVNDVSLKIETGSIYGIIGFSGAGKSTLVRCINLLERPTSGHVYIDDVEMTSLSNSQLREKRKKIGMIFQQFNLFASRTVFKNVAYPLRYRGLSKKEIEKKVMALLELVDIKEKAFAYPSQLSGGQKQRVAIARALAMKPEILLCDEPTSALDPELIGEVLSVLKELAKEKMTMIVVSHEISFVRELSTNIAFMDYGKIIAMDNSEDFFNNQKNERIIDFLNKIFHK